MRSIWWTRRAVGLHVTIIVLFPTFLLLGWWQLHRALSGNGLSWAYTFEWPFFACYSVVLWWKLVHEQPAFSHLAKPKAKQPARSLEREAKEEQERAAYNAYLESLRVHDERRGARP